MKKIISLIFIFVLGLCSSVSCWAQKTVFVAGACFSADIGYFMKPSDNMKCVEAARFTNIISIVSDKPKVDISELVKSNDRWRKKVILDDVNKTFFDQLKEGKPDVLLIDFHDEAYDLIKINNSYISNANHTMSKHPDFRKQLLNMGKILKEKDRLDLWKKSFDIFVKRVNETIGPNKIVVNKMYHAEQYVDKNNRYSKFDLNNIKYKNKMLDIYYNYVKEKYPNIKFIEYNPKLILGKKEHRWGACSLHFIDAFYRNTIDQLNKL